MLTFLKNVFSRFGSFIRLTTTAMGSGLTPGTLVSKAIQYGPLIAALIEYLDQQESEAQRRQAMTDFERGFRVLTQTKSPKALKDAIMAHCGPDGCMLP